MAALARVRRLLRGAALWPSLCVEYGDEVPIVAPVRHLAVSDGHDGGEAVVVGPSRTADVTPWTSYSGPDRILGFSTVSGEQRPQLQFGDAVSEDPQSTAQNPRPDRSGRGRID